MIRKLRIVAVVLSVFIASFSFAQLTEPGGGAGNAPNDTGIAGGGAPIGSGMFILVALGAIYARKKMSLIKEESNL